MLIQALKITEIAKTVINVIHVVCNDNGVSNKSVIFRYCRLPQSIDGPNIFG